MPPTGSPYAQAYQPTNQPTLKQRSRWNITPITAHRLRMNSVTQLHFVSTCSGVQVSNSALPFLREKGTHQEVQHTCTCCWWRSMINAIPSA